jgi:hypothetical protein
MKARDYCFISYDIEDPQSRLWAEWIARQLPAGSSLEAVVPHPSWALGYWTCSLRETVAAARLIVAVLTPGFLSASHPFVQELRRLVLQESTDSQAGQGAVPRLLVALVQDCSAWLDEGSVLYRAPFVDLRPLLEAKLTCHRSFLEQLQAWGFSQPELGPSAARGAAAGARPLLSADSRGPGALSAWLARSGAQ